MICIERLLNKAKKNHGLRSDYKLALVMGVSQSSIANYRSHKTYPDSRIISLICELSGDDPAIVAVELEVQKAKNPEAKALWKAVSRRLESVSFPRQMLIS